MMNWSFKKKEERQAKTLPLNQLDSLFQTGRFYGVQLHKSSCKACSQLAGRVFSFNNAPKLPLDGCDSAVCNCEYLGVVDPRRTIDRRSGGDRRVDIRMSVERRHEQDRRSQSDNWKGFDQ